MFNWLFKKKKATPESTALEQLFRLLENNEIVGWEIYSDTQFVMPGLVENRPTKAILRFLPRAVFLPMKDPIPPNLKSDTSD
jgi:hypothetical protein